MKIFKIFPLLWLTALILAALLDGCNKKNPAPGSKEYYESLQEYYWIAEDEDPTSERCTYAEDLRALGEKLLHDKATFDQDLSTELDKLSIKTTSSPDGKLKIYTWDNGEGGTMICHNSIYQTYCNGKFHADFMQDYEELPLNIFQVESAKGPVYLVQFFFQECSSIGVSGVEAFTMNKKGKLELAEVFESIGDLCNTTEGYSCCLYTENYFRLPPSVFCDGGWDDNLFFEKSRKDIYMPYFSDKGGAIMYDYYHLFEWNGDKFQYRYPVFNPVLKKYIGDKGQLAIEFELGKSIIRIDKMEDGTYRYIAWKKDKMFADKPDLIITDGWYHEVEHLFHFKNKDHEYVFNTQNHHLHIYQTTGNTDKKQEIANYEIEDLYFTDLF